MSSRSCACTTCWPPDNLFKSGSIKILVNALGIEKFREAVEADWEATHKAAVDLPEMKAAAHRLVFRAA